MNKESTSPPNYDVCIIGGAGHIGAPLAIVLASRGLKTLICDINQKSIDTLASGELPFLEEHGEEHLTKALEAGTLGFTTDHEDIKGIPSIILTIGTPIDEFHNPVFSLISNLLDQIIPSLTDEQTLILRSTVAPGTCEFIDTYLKQQGKQTKLAFCPERVVQGKAIEEIQNLPQLWLGPLKLDH